MIITTGRGNAARSTEVATGHLFCRRPKDERKSVVAHVCHLAGIKAA